MGGCWWICYAKQLCNSTKPLVCEASHPNAIGTPYEVYDDLYLTEQP
jgi:hypothetical protein